MIPRSGMNKARFGCGRRGGLLIYGWALQSSPRAISISATRGRALLTGSHCSSEYKLTQPESPVSQYLSLFTVIADPLHHIVLGTIESWLRLCGGEKHKDCPHEGQMTPLPTRLLDLNGLPERGDMIDRSAYWHAMFQDGSCKLAETASGNTGQYVALSYCWGKHVPFTTTSTNLQAHKEENGILFVRLPKTLQDAVLLVRYLGFRYLWVDCLCIVQDDLADWEYEAARMADVYSNAFLVIAAMRASHCGEGFLEPRTPREKMLPIVFSDQEGAFTVDLRYHDYTMSPGSLSGAVELAPLKLQRVGARLCFGERYVNRIQEEPMMNRVWCFQERVLARRTLHFTRHELYWECEVGLIEETTREPGGQIRYTEYCISDIARGLINRKDFGWVGPRPKFEYREQRAWYDVVLEYTSRDLTYQKDKLPALSGIIAAIAKISGDTCYAGIWRSWFLPGLLWQTQDPTLDQYVYVSKTPMRPTGWRAPSWSFASIEGVVTYDSLPADVELCRELQECCVIPEGRNPLGELLSGFARIRAPRSTIFDIGEIEEDGQISSRKGKVRLRDQTERAVNVYFDVERLRTCDALMITPVLGIAVRPINMDEQQFVRVGLVEMHLLRNPRRPQDVFERLSPSDWPEPLSITLL